jgi:hypothetical protein
VKKEKTIEELTNDLKDGLKKEQDTKKSEKEYGDEDAKTKS